MQKNGESSGCRTVAVIIVAAVLALLLIVLICGGFALLGIPLRP